ncbi:ABC transporter substrate-binding protein [Ostreibacterium oceani]
MLITSHHRRPIRVSWGGLKQSNPKKATRRASVWWLLISRLFSPRVAPRLATRLFFRLLLRLLLRLCLFFSLTSSFTSVAAQDSPQRFVSLSLCSDRLLIEIANEASIAALSTYSTRPDLMLDRVNRTHPTVKPQINDLLPYADATFLINETFYPQLTRQLRTLNFHVIALNDSTTSPEALIEHINTLGNITNNPSQSRALVAKIKALEDALPALPHDTALVIGYGGLMAALPQYQPFLDLLNLAPSTATQANRRQQISIENLLANPVNNLIFLTHQSHYSRANAFADNPVLQQLSASAFTIKLATKYLSCYDHGIWLGATQVAAARADFLKARDTEKHQDSPQNKAHTAKTRQPIQPQQHRSSQ